MPEQLSKDQKNFIIGSIRNILPDAEIMVYGSRINGRAAKYSDLDIALKSDNGIDLIKIGIIEDIFDNSEIPFKIQILDYNRLSSEFRDNIDRNCVKW